MNDKISLENLNDTNRAWLCDLSFVDITKEGCKKINEEGLTIQELRNYVKNPDLPFCGDIFLGAKKFNMMTGILLGNKSFPSNLDVVDALIENGLGDFKIIHTSEYPKPPSSGFLALTFKDSYNNVGISYRGSDLYISKLVVREWIESNILEYFSNTSSQVIDSLEYFLKHQNPNGNNYIFGHSLGGNLVSHVYLRYHDFIKKAFSINGTPINQKLIDTEDKINAFNDKEKFSFNIVGGDLVSQLKSCELYKNNVNYIKNNNIMKPSVLSAHMIQSSTIDDEGNFVKITELETQKETNYIVMKLINFSKFVREKMNEVNFKLTKNNNHKFRLKEEEIYKINKK